MVKIERVFQLDDLGEKENFYQFILKRFEAGIDMGAFGFGHM